MPGYEHISPVSGVHSRGASPIVIAPPTSKGHEAPGCVSLSPGLPLSLSSPRPSLSVYAGDPLLVSGEPLLAHRAGKDLPLLARHGG